MDISAHEHLMAAAVTLVRPTNTWEGVKSFGIAALVIYGGLFSITNAAAYSKIAVSSVQDAVQNYEANIPAQTANALTLDPWTQKILSTTTASAPSANSATHPDDLAALLPTPASSNDRIVIPSLKVNAPVIEPSLGLEALKAQDFTTLEEQIQETLLQGVVHYPGTAEPGQKGNAFLTGHSSNVFWQLSDYNTVFALLPKIKVGDDIYVTNNLTEYHYRVVDKKEVQPTDVSALQQGDDYKLTLVTCTPVGTTFRRLVVTALLVKD
jgi:LPXTG-site transpeptidase (sortase) family protein